MTEETLEALMVKVVDGTATPAEREALMAHLADHPDLQKELEMHQSLKAITDGWVRRLELDLLEDEHRTRTLPRLWTRLGLTLLLVGTALLVGGGTVELFLDPEVPLWARLGTVGLEAGSLILLAAVGLRRFQTAKHDRYTEVIR
ncbi:MAG: hypothetical protein H6737_21150 [Alphaproteobacteria bacterium]|nr:hypothetical protein [Alphaproteobacteria bacterium]